jgi:hypothetical protein
MPDVLARLRLAGRDWPPLTSALLGESVTVEAIFTDAAGAPVDVTGVTATAYRPPLPGEATGTTPALALTRVSAGVWSGVRLLDRVGDWAIHAQCAAPSVAVARADLRVTLGGPEALEEPRAAASAAASASAATTKAAEAAVAAATASAAAAAAAVAGAEAGADAALDAVAPQIAQSVQLAANVTASVANAAPSYTTWAALNATTPANLSLAVLIADDSSAGKLAGVYRYTAGAWVYDSPTLPALATRVDGVEEVIASGDAFAGSMLLFRARASGQVFGGVTDYGLRFFAAGTSWTYDANARVSRWARFSAGGPVAELGEDGLRVSGALGFVGGARLSDELTDQPYSLHLRTPQGFSTFAVGARAAYLLGMGWTWAQDGSRTLVDEQATPLMHVAPDGAVSLRGRRIITADDGQVSPMVLALRDPAGRLSAYGNDEFGRLYLLGSPSPDYEPAPKPDQITFYGLTGTGDESAALQAAVSSASAAGIRSLDFGDLTINAPSASGLDAVIFRGAKGRGQLVGPYRKQVIPYGAPAAILARPAIIPSVHLPALRAASSRSFVVVGDSTVRTSRAGVMGARMTDFLSAALQRAYPGIAYWDRSIGGSTFANLLSVPSSGFPLWYTDQARAWLAYVADVAPHAVLCVFGENDGAGLTFETLDSVRAALLGLTPVPDVLFATCNTPSSTVAPTKAAREQRERNAGMVRSFARRRHHGVLDFGRQCSIVRDGVDTVEAPLIRQQVSVAGSLPLTLPECGGYAMNFRSGANLTGILAGGAILELPLSGMAGNSLLFRLAGSVWEYRLQTSDTRAVVDWTSTGVSSVGDLDFTVRSTGQVICALNRIVVVDTIMDRAGGLFTPLIGRKGDPLFTFAVTIVSSAIEEPLICAPELTDPEMYGVGADLQINHMDDRGRVAVYERLINATTWAA